MDDGEHTVSKDYRRGTKRSVNQHVRPGFACCVHRGVIVRIAPLASCLSV